MRTYLFIIVLLHFYTTVFTQTDSTEVLDDKIFELLEDVEQENDDGQYYEIIEEFLFNPINLNNASMSDLLKLPFLSSTDAKKIIKKRKELQYFDSINDLEKIDIDQNTIILLKPFIIIDNPVYHHKPNNFGYSFRSRLKNDLQNRSGFENGNYNGNKISLYNRFIIKNKNLRIGLLTEKDSGERDYLDHYTGFIEYKTNGLVENILVGDFTIEFGEGLALWSAYAFSKGSDAVNPVIKRNRNISAHLSSEENKHFRGGAVSLNIFSGKITLFYSSNIISANLDYNNGVSNFYQSGYYRTDSELEKKNNLNEIVSGISYYKNFNEYLALGVLHYQVNYNKPFSFVNINKLSGKKFSFTSFTYNAFISNMNLNGEIAYNGSAFSTIMNLSLKINSNIAMLASYRNYSSQFYNIFSNGFGEFGNTQNELGYYLGTKIKTTLGYLNIYYDIFRSHSESYFSDFPASGADFLINYNAKIYNSVQLGLKYKWEKKEKQKELKLNDVIIDEVKSNYRIEFKYKLNKALSGKSRIELVNFSGLDKIETGFLSFQEIKYTLPNYFSISLRIIFFDTDSYNSRLYEFENDLRGVMSNLPLFGEGIRWYLLFSYSPFDKFVISAKYSESYKPSEKYISSGNSQIYGNIDNRINFQLDYNF